MADDRRDEPDVPLIPFENAYEGRSPFASSTKPPWARRFVPLLGSMRGYSRHTLPVDALAGLTVAALALPASMAYAELAGLPVTAGLYALLLPVLAYALLGSGLRVMVGPEGAVALLVASALAPLAAAGSAEYTTLAAALAQPHQLPVLSLHGSCAWAGLLTTSPRRYWSATSRVSPC